MFILHREVILSPTKYCGSCTMSVTGTVSGKYDVHNYIIAYTAEEVEVCRCVKLKKWKAVSSVIYI